MYSKGCSGYIHMDDYSTYGVTGGSTTLAECAAAVKTLDGTSGCQGEYFFFETGGYCNCPTDDCTLTSANENAGGSGQLYKFTDDDATATDDDASITEATKARRQPVPNREDGEDGEDGEEARAMATRHPTRA